MKKYSLHLIAGIFTILMSVTIFNWLINPYDVFAVPEIEGLNRYKVEVLRHTRLSKVYQVERIKPEAILLASSRGLVIPASYFSDDMMTAFNLALSSASTYELLRVFQHAQASHPLKRVVLAIDEDFTETRQSNFSEGRLLVDLDGTVNRKKWLQKMKDSFSSLLSIDALRSSIRTIRMQNYKPGHLDQKKYDYERIIKAGGHRQMFRTMESSIFYNYQGPVHDCQVSAAEHEVLPGAVNYFERMVSLAYDNDIDMYIYFSPTHARLYETQCMIGKWPTIEEMKREVVKVVENEAKKSGVSPYPVWDFSGYNMVTTEAVPLENDRANVMRWYWEGSHYTKKTAKLILDKVFYNSDVLSDFGVKLTAENIDKHLSDIRDKRDLYLRTNKNDIDELHLLFEDLRHK